MIKVDAKNARKLLLISEFLVCYFPLLVIYALGVFITPFLLFSMELSGLLLLLLVLIPATLGLMGVTSMLMELVTDEVQLPRKMQVVFTIVGMTLAIVILIWSYNTSELDYRALFLVAPVICALHFIFISKTIHANAGRLGS